MPEFRLHWRDRTTLRQIALRQPIEQLFKISINNLIIICDLNCFLWARMLGVRKKCLENGNRGCRGRFIYVLRLLSQHHTCLTYISNHTPTTFEPHLILKFLSLVMMDQPYFSSNFLSSTPSLKSKKKKKRAKCAKYFTQTCFGALFTHLRH